MSAVATVLDLHGVAAYGLIGGTVLAGTGAIIGFALPCGAAVVVGGVLAARHSVALAPMIAVVVVAAVVGDALGYAIGRRYGCHLTGRPEFDRYRSRVRRAGAWLRRRDGSIVFAAHFVPVARTAAPWAAGTSRMRFSCFLRWAGAGAAAWGSGLTLIGYGIGHGAQAFETDLGQVGGAFVAATLLLRCAWLLRRSLTGLPRRS